MIVHLDKTLLTRKEKTKRKHCVYSHLMRESRKHNLVEKKMEK